jgi:Transglutaminase-like superfamily
MVRYLGKRSISDVFLFLQILFFAAAVPFLLRLKLARVETLLQPRIPRSTGQDRMEQITEYVEIAIRKGRPLVRQGCLTRGLTRYYFFRREGLNVSLCFGMGQVEEEFVGHCWLLKDGVPFLETRDPRPLYAEMYRMSGTAHRGEIPSGKSQLEQSRS